MESKETLEVTAPTVEEATLLGLTRLGITREEAFIEVLDEGSAGFFGFGAREARVRITRRPMPAGRRARELGEETPPPVPVREPAPPEAPVEAPPAHPAEAEPEAPTVKPVSPAPSAPRSQATPQRRKPPVEEPKGERLEVELPQKEEKRTSQEPAKREKPDRRPGFDKEQVEDVVRDIADHLFADMQITSSFSWKEEQRSTLWVILKGKDASSLVGRRGRNLDALQYLMRALVRRRVSGNFNLVVDADGYRRRRHRSLRRLARRTAEKVAASGQEARLRPMPARERRIIHVTLQQDERVGTRSFGSGRLRAVTVYPKTP